MTSLILLILSSNLFKVSVKNHLLTLNAFAATDHFNTVGEVTKITPAEELEEYEYLPGSENMEVAEVNIWSPFYVL